MGEAIYYARIRFKNKDACQKAAPEIKAFFLELCRAEQFWQESRGCYLPRTNGKEYKEYTNEEFWSEFGEKFPVVSDYLKMLGNDYHDKPIWGGDRNNGLAGKIDIAYHEAEVENGFEVGDKEILYWAEVWHFAEWDGYVDFIKANWDGKMTWVSDEYLDPFSYI